MPVEDEPEIRAIALKEARTRLAEVESILRAGKPEPGSDEFETVKRHMHSLKGLGSILGSAEMEQASRAIHDALTSRHLAEAAPEGFDRDLGRITESFALLDSRRPGNSP